MTVTHMLRLALLPALALTVCSSCAHSTTGTPTPVAANSPNTVPATVAAEATTTASATGAQTTMARSHSGPGRCVSSSLRASLGQRQGAAGTSYVTLLLTNRSPVSCTLDGYPGVSFVAGAAAHLIGTPAQPDRRTGAKTVILAPGATAHVTVAVANYANYDKQACQPARATGYRIYPPGSTGSLLITAPQLVCSKPGLQGFRTSVVLTGPGSG
jgi:hypothetical protein